MAGISSANPRVSSMKSADHPVGGGSHRISFVGKRSDPIVPGCAEVEQQSEFGHSLTYRSGNSNTR